jgi:hypothetical protein
MHEALIGRLPYEWESIKGQVLEVVSIALCFIVVT